MYDLNKKCMYLLFDYICKYYFLKFLNVIIGVTFLFTKFE